MERILSFRKSIAKLPASRTQTLDWYIIQKVQPAIKASVVIHQDGRIMKHQHFP
jgi:hypothetical protein